MNTYEKSFPFKKIREQQSQAIDFCIENIDEKRFFIIEAGTGVGKSAIGLTLARELNKRIKQGQDINKGSYFVTTQKILQQQYVDDFSSISSLSSYTNYMCTHHRSNTCSQSQQLLKTEEKGSKFFKNCVFNCKYKKDKQKFLDSEESITNFSYLLTEANYSGKIVPRNVLIIDEGHNIETELSKFIEISVSENFCKNVLKIPFISNPTQYRAFKWINEVYLPVAKRRISFFENSIEKFGGARLREKLKEFQSLTRQFDLLRSHITKIEKFVKIYDKENWVFDIDKSSKFSLKKMTFKPVNVSHYAEDVLFRLGTKVIIMSATILNHKVFKETLGITERSSCFISLPTPFKTENRPIIFSPVGSMSAKNIDNTLPKLTVAIKAILDHHSGEKGIIHCKTYKIAEHLKRTLRNNRILTHDSTNRDMILEKHIKSKNNTVLLSPSMTEGVDLRDDSSRFQILCKVPYPYLGDKLVRKRMNTFSGWYELQTTKSIVQSVGRSIRNENDHAATYILDSDFDRFFNKNKNMFSNDFKKCIVK